MPSGFQELLGRPENVGCPRRDALGFADRHLRSAREVFHEGGHLRVEEGTKRLHALDRDSFRDLPAHIRNPRNVGGQFPGSSPDLIGEEQFADRGCE